MITKYANSTRGLIRKNEERVYLMKKTIIWILVLVLIFMTTLTGCTKKTAGPEMVVRAVNHFLKSVSRLNRGAWYSEMSALAMAPRKVMSVRLSARDRLCQI